MTLYYLIIITKNTVLCMSPLTDATIRTEIQNYNSKHFHSNDAIEKDQIESWDTSLVTDLSFLFLHSFVMDGITYGDLSKWYVSNVTDMQGMFASTSKFNGNLSAWDVSKVTNMKSMFNSAISFNTNISKWNVSKVQNMHGMFASAKIFNSDISDWDVSNCVYMQYMFYEAEKFNRNMDLWNVLNVRNMDGMFQSALSFQQKICWDVSSNTTRVKILDGSPGRLSEYPKCLNGTTVPTKQTSSISSHALTRKPTLRITDMPTVSPTSRPVIDTKVPKSPTSRPTKISTIHQKSISMNKEKLKSKEFKSYNELTTTSPTLRKSSLNKTRKISPLSSTFGPLWIISSSSSDNQVSNKLCLYPFHNSLMQGTRISIAKCKKWNIFQWIIDYEGKIMPYLNPNMCIQISGKLLTLDFCRAGNRSQRWIYNSNGNGFHSVQNGRKRMMILNTMDSPSGSKFVYGQVSKFGQSTDLQSQSFDIMYNYDFTTIQPVPSEKVFSIISHVTTNGQNWCLYPKNNSLFSGNKISISECKSWNSYKWMTDSEGKIINVRDPTKCITRLHDKLIISHCINGNSYQRWMYSVFDQRIVWIKNSYLQVVLKNNMGFTNAIVGVVRSENILNLPAHHKWNINSLQ